MPVRFRCAACGKIHRIDDHHAGKRGRCGKCGHRFVAPGTPPPTSPSAVFVPSAPPDLDLDDLDLRGSGKSTGRRPSLGGTIGFGLGLAALAVVLLVSFRDEIVRHAPGLAPALPPAAARPLPQPVPLAVAPATPDLDGTLVSLGAMTLTAMLISVAFFVVLVVLPMVVPPLLSRRGYLSVARWLIMAGVAGFLGLLFGLIATVVLFPFGIFLALFSPFVWLVVGCLIAAAIHPRATAL